MTPLKLLSGIGLGVIIAYLWWKFAEFYVMYALGGNDYALKNRHNK